MTQRDLFGGVTMRKTLKHPVELECEVRVLTDAAARLLVISDGREMLEWVPLSLIEFRGNGEPQLGAQIIDIEKFKAKEIGAI
jgi:hypothetical protein